MQIKKCSKNGSARGLMNRSGASVVSLMLIVALVAGGGFLAWKYYQGRETPREAAQKILDATFAGDMAAIKCRITDATNKEIVREYGTEDTFISTMKLVFGKVQSQSGDVITCVGEGTPEGADGSFVIVGIKSGKPIFPETADAKIGLVMVRESSRWKLDAQRTEAHNVDEMDRCFRTAGKLSDWKLRYERSKENHSGTGMFTLFPFPAR